MNHNIAIDGPAGAGKSTIAKIVAKELESIYVDTGAMYRAIAIFLIRRGFSVQELNPRDERYEESIVRVEEALREAEVSIEYREGQQIVLLNGENVTPHLREESTGNMASVSSAIPAVRAKLLDLQRALAARTAVVMDGRDIGTVVLPDAQVKIFLTASVETRAQRRYRELIGKGETADLEQIAADIAERDERDMNRPIAPLKQAEDAKLVDSSNLTIPEVTDVILRYFCRKNNIVIAESAGFCFGVKRAVQLVHDCIDEKEKNGGTPGSIYNLGPIIHNEYVVKEMESHGVITLQDESELEQVSEGTVVLRSHGVSKKVVESLEEKEDVTIVDATCPFVKKIHKIVREESGKGKQIVIIGDPQHPEVIGTMGWSETPCIVISEKEEAAALKVPENKPLCVVAQTTFNLEKFKELVEIIKKLGYDIVVLNTICNATSMRQTEARSLAESSDIMLVVGSGTSSNTRKLYEICQEGCANTYYIQSLDDLNPIQFQSDSCVGITAGASTPNYFIQEVSRYVRRAKL
ncbi:MAG: 4-hydroxy-3-methylbut-2-enyl diphosphate reductase [Lachnospiraceae bacterium]|nr:4-hydroxy-3-methylbut-2-enyl diphosphate reductase [Lachnospiraceae bacterium]